MREGGHDSFSGSVRLTAFRNEAPLALLEQSTPADSLSCEPIILGHEASDLHRKPVILVVELGVLGRKPFVLSRKNGHLLLSDVHLPLGLVSLLLTKLYPILPEARSSSLCLVAHRSGFISMAGPSPSHRADTRHKLTNSPVRRATAVHLAFRLQRWGPNGGEPAGPRHPHTLRHRRPTRDTARGMRPAS